MSERVAAICREIEAELDRAVSLHAPQRSAHEGYAVILEELDELWEIVKLRVERRDMQAMRKEAIQVAAMAARFVLDVCPAPQPAAPDSCPHCPPDENCSGVTRPTCATCGGSTRVCHVCKLGDEAGCAHARRFYTIDCPDCTDGGGA